MTLKKQPFKLCIVFVAVICEFASDDHKKEIANLLTQYTFSRIMDNVFESSRINEKSIMRLKHDLDKMTDSYDVIRIYQYPMDDTLVITSLKDKKWRRIRVLS